MRLQGQWLLNNQVPVLILRLSLPNPTNQAHLTDLGNTDTPAHPKQPNDIPPRRLVFAGPETHQHKIRFHVGIKVTADLLNRETNKKVF
jgi:hypothetical protein